MKKFYLALATSIVSVGCALATPPRFEQSTVDLTPRVAETTPSVELSVPAVQTSTAIKPLASPEGEWEKVSTGIWFEGPLAACAGQATGQWEVDVYENTSVRGWYRVYPYFDGSPMAQNVGGAFNDPLDICAVNPEKVYFESWKPYGIEFRTACPEGGFGNELYGTLTDNVIELNGCVAYASNGNWYFLNGSIKLALNKESYVDYTVDLEVPVSTTASKQYLKFTKSESVATVKIYPIEGIYPMTDGNANFVVQYGIDATAYAGQGVGFGLKGPHKIYSYLYVGLDASNAVKVSGVKYTIISDDDTDNWTSIGEGNFNEAFITEFFSDVETENIKCEIQENKASSGYFRLVNPYANFSPVTEGSFSVPAEPANHYLYVNATDAAHVYVEPSAPGLYINSSFGSFMTYTMGNSYLNDVAAGETAGVWGTLADGKIVIPTGNVRLYMPAYDDSFFKPKATNDIVINLPAGYSAISAVEGDDATAPVEYFNLQGMKIENPAAGQVVIRRQGNSVSKIIR